MTARGTMKNCPSEETLAAVIHGRLDSESRGRVVKHVAVCGECRNVVLAAHEEASTAKLIRGRFGGRWLAPLVTAAAVAAALLLILPIRDRLLDRTGVSAVVDASSVLAYRPSEARLSADFPYKATRRVLRGGGQDPEASENLRFLEMSARLEDHQGAPTIERLHARALAHLFLGQYDIAVRILNDAIRRAESSGASEEKRAALLNDVAVVHFERARRGDQKDLIVAMDAAEQSWRIQRTSATAWTRALLLEAMNLKPAAAQAWREYLKMDSSSAWAVEAREASVRVASESPFSKFSLTGKERLLAACHENDGETVARIVVAHPKEARMFGEEELLPAWASGMLARAGDAGASDLQCARTLGEALREHSGESLLAETASHIDDSTTDNARRLTAHAILAYRAGRDAYVRKDIAAAEPLLQNAEDRLRRVGSPLAVLADVYHAGALHWGNRYSEVAPSFDETLEPCVHPQRYLAACGLRKWIVGLAMVQTGSPGDSIDAYDVALVSFRAIREVENVASVLGLRAETLDSMTAYDEAWSDRMAAVAMFPGPLSARPTLWKSIAAAAVRDHYEWAANVVLAEIGADARRHDDPLYVTEALMWQMLARSRMEREYKPEVAALQRALASIDDDAVRARTEANLRIVLAEINAGSAETAGADDLDRALSFYRQASDRFNGMSVLAQRATARASARDYSAADADLVEAVREFEHQAADVGDPFLRTLFSDRARQMFLDASRVQIARGRPAAALWFSDAARLAALPANSSPRRCMPASVDATAEQHGLELIATVPRGVAVVHQDLTDDRLLTWIVADGRLSFIASPIDRTAVTDDVERLIAAAAGGRSSDIVPPARKLYDILLGGVEKKVGDRLLVYSPSGRLRRVPIALLYDGRRFLAEKRALATTLTIGMLACSRPANAVSAALLVAADEDLGSERLRGVRRELAALERVYGRRADILVGPDATPTSFLRKIDAYDLIHVAAHGRTDRRPLHNAIEFGAERLRAFDVLSAHLERRPVVVLAACRSDDDTEGRSTVSLATAFVAAGASAVVGTLWDVDDEATANFVREFHEHLSRGMKPHDALRAAQQESMRRGTDARVWAAFQVQI